MVNMYTYTQDEQKYMSQGFNIMLCMGTMCAVLITAIESLV